MMKIRKFWGPAPNYLKLSAKTMQGIRSVVSRGSLLNEKQCGDLSSKLLQILQNIQELVPKLPCRQSTRLSISKECRADPTFRPALRNFYRILEKAKSLVQSCSNKKWCKAAVFQIHNEEAFREILVEAGLCYHVIYEQAKATMWSAELFSRIQDLRDTSLFLPATESDVLEDEQTLQERLEDLAMNPNPRSSSDWDKCLATYLLGKLKCKGEEFTMSGALFWVEETEPKGSWTFQGVLGKGSGSAAVCISKWVGMPCARKEFHHKVSDHIFKKEAEVLAVVNHPNIVKFLCCSNDEKQGKCFLGMELMEMSLGKLISIREKKPFPYLVALDIIEQIARGMCYLHDLGIAHRDLKPDNVMVNKLTAPYHVHAFCVKLVDFGMSKTKVEVSKSHTISLDGVGTTIYRAPEAFPKAQRRAQEGEAKAYWFKADVYSFAVTCAHILTVNSPYEEVPRCDLHDKLMSGLRPELPINCPEQLVALLKECWSENPRSRPGFLEICTRLAELRQDLLRRPSPLLNRDFKNESVRGTHIERMLRKCSELRQLQVSVLNAKRVGKGSTLINTVITEAVSGADTSSFENEGTHSSRSSQRCNMDSAEIVSAGGTISTFENQEMEPQNRSLGELKDLVGRPCGLEYWRGFSSYSGDSQDFQTPRRVESLGGGLVFQQSGHDVVAVMGLGSSSIRGDRKHSFKPSNAPLHGGRHHAWPHKLSGSLRVRGRAFVPCPLSPHFLPVIR